MFNTYDDAGDNNLWLGQFYTQTPPESLENVMLLDTYMRHGAADIAVLQSDGSIWIVYERNIEVMAKWRDRNSTWQTRSIAHNAQHPCLSAAGGDIHFIWEQHSQNSDRTYIKTTRTDGTYWSRVQTIASATARHCYPYIADGAVAVWSDLHQGKLDVFASRRTAVGSWTAPQNISQTSETSAYPQVAYYAAGSDTHLVYVWTEGDAPPYEVKTYSSGDLKTNTRDHTAQSASVKSNIVKGVLKINCASACADRIKARLYDRTGRMVAEVLDQDIRIGNNEFSYDCEHLSNGVYFLKIETAGETKTHKIVIFR